MAPPDLSKLDFRLLSRRRSKYPIKGQENKQLIPRNVQRGNTKRSNSSSSNGQNNGPPDPKGGGGNNNNGNNGNNNDGGNSGSNNDGNNNEDPKSPPCSFCIADNDPRVKYSGEWILNSDPFGQTTHSTTTPGSQVSLMFNGSAIAIFGTVPANNLTVGPPTASFLLDSDPPVETQMPAASRNIPNQPIFASSQLASDQEHQITINVTDAPTPFTLDYFFLFPVSKPDQDSAGSSSTRSTSPPTASSGTPETGSSVSKSALADTRKTVTIVSAVLSSFILIIFIVLAWFGYRRCRKRRNIRYTQNSRIRDWNLRADTIFTSSDSIMRNNPSILASRVSRSQKIAADFANPFRSPPPIPTHSPPSVVSAPTGAPVTEMIISEARHTSL